MKVAVVGSLWLDTPPKGYGGTEEVIGNIVNGLVDKGHDVTFFGPKTSTVKSKIFTTVGKPLREQNVEWTNVTYILYHLTEVFDHASEFDVIHMHLNKSQDYFSLPLAKCSKTPVVFTFHFMLPNLSYNVDRYRILEKYKSLPFTSISNSQRAGLPWNFVATVYNGIEVSKFPFQEKTEDYFVWLGKVNPVKGTREAIVAAKRAGVKLYVLGAIDLGVPKLLEYYNEAVKPLIDNKNIVWVGEVNMEEKARILGKAKAFLNPIQWEEPFGLVMTESQAVGTPVISFKRGAAPELIIDGKTGFLVETVDEMVAKMKDVDSLSRADCRKNVEEKFSVEKMIEGYENVYKKVIGFSHRPKLV